MRGLILLVVALLLGLVLLPIGFIYQCIYTLLKGLNKYLFKIAKSIDQLGNVVCTDLFNHTLIKKSSNLFGNEDETISSVLGKNKLAGTLTGPGKALSWLLNKIEKDHVEKAIE